MLTKLLRKDEKWTWTDEHSEVMSEFKKILMTTPLLIIFDPNLQTILYTDASRDGLSGTLMQVTDQGEKPVAYYSRQTSTQEKNYHSFELELLAIEASVDKFRYTY